LIAIAKLAQSKNELHPALVTGVPGAGKTLVGIQLVYENHLDSSDIRNNAVFLSGRSWKSGNPEILNILMVLH
jgi:hypothetical protein